LTGFGLVALALLALTGQHAWADDIDMKAVTRAHAFLKSAKRGEFIGGFCHFGTTYQRHSYAKSLKVTDRDERVIPGHFALAYDFTMSDDIKTQLAFLCDAKGNVYKVQVLSSNGVFQRPYALANISIKLVGEAVYESIKDNLAEADRKAFRRLVDNADAEGLMLFCLRVQQASE
jgi:hypothetical protein